MGERKRIGRGEKGERRGEERVYLGCIAKKSCHSTKSQGLNPKSIFMPKET